MTCGGISAIWRSRAADMMWRPGGKPCRNFFCGLSADREEPALHKKTRLEAGFVSNSGRSLIKLIANSELCLPAAAQARAGGKAVDQRNLVVGILVSEGEQRRLIVGFHPFEFQEVGNVSGFIHSPVLADEVAEVQHVHCEGQGMFLPVLVLAGVEVDVFADVE